MHAQPQLIDPETVKTHFPRWRDFCTLPDYDAEGHVPTPDEVLADAIVMAETELLELVAVNAATITPQLTRHLLNLVRKHCFDVQHGDTPFEHAPQVVRDYNASIAMLERYFAGEMPTPEPPGDAPHHVRMTTRGRRFASRFHDS